MARMVHMIIFVILNNFFILKILFRFILSVNDIIHRSCWINQERYTTYWYDFSISANTSFNNGPKSSTCCTFSVRDVSNSGSHLIPLLWRGLFLLQTLLLFVYWCKRVINDTYSEYRIYYNKHERDFCRWQAGNNISWRDHRLPGIYTQKFPKSSKPLSKYPRNAFFDI